MMVFRHIDRINLLDKLIRQRRTGTPAELAKRLGISTSRLYIVLGELKAHGAPIGYCRQSRTYYYEHSFSISISVKIEGLDEKELRIVSAGQGFFSPFSPTAFFAQ